MSSTVRLSSAAMAQAGGLLVAGVGLSIEYFTGVPGFPLIPPGPILLIVAAILVWTLTPRFRWIAVVGLLAALFIAVGALGSGGFRRIGDPGDVGPWIGTTLTALGLVVALVGGALALVQAVQRSRQRVTS